MSQHTLTPEQISGLRIGVRELAGRLGCDLPAAWEAMALPSYVYAAATAAADAAGPAAPAEGDDFVDLLAPDTAEREAASRACLDAIRAEVLAA